MFFHILRFLASLGMTTPFCFSRFGAAPRRRAIARYRYAAPGQSPFCPVIPNPEGVRNLGRQPHIGRRPTHSAPAAHWRQPHII